MSNTFIAGIDVIIKEAELHMGQKHSSAKRDLVPKSAIKGSHRKKRTRAT